MKEGPLDPLVKILARLPGLGPRSARRAALHLLTNKDKTMRPLVDALETAMNNIMTCGQCGNLDTQDPCRICNDERRANDMLCVVAGVADLWAVERTGSYKGRYHVLGGVLSALDGIGPEDLSIRALLERVRANPPAEIILALSATVDGQATAHYLTDQIEDLAGKSGLSIRITRLAHGVPMGGELDYLDEGTITTALKSRASL